MKRLTLFIWVALLPTAFGASPKTFRDHFISYEIELTAAPKARYEKKLLLLTRIRSESSGVDYDWLLAIIKQRLGRLGVAFTVTPLSAFREFEQASDRKELVVSRLSEVTHPRLVIDIHLEPVPNSAFVTAHGNLHLLHYSAEGMRLEPRVGWSREFQIQNLSSGEIRERLVTQLRKDLDQFASHKNRAHQGYESSIPTARAAFEYKAPPLPAPEAEKYNALLMGVGLGTPATVNLFLGGWGIVGLPMSADISGMYYSRESRGVQADIGYIFDKKGVLQQSAGLAVAAFNHRSQEKIEHPAVDGPGSTETITSDRFHLYVGPLYQLQWNSVRVGGGFGVATNSDASSSVRAFFQIGFAPRILSQ